MKRFVLTILNVERKDMERRTAEELLQFIEKSPSAFHAVDTMKRVLDERKYEQLLEGDTWKLLPGGNYYVIRGGTSLIAFRIPSDKIRNRVSGGFRGFQIMASHSDSPTFKVKENPEMEAEKAYVKLNVEKYGGMLIAPWFDRPLSVAGRLIVRENEKVVSKLVKVDKDLLLIPSLAVHMDRQANEGHKYNVQKELLPLYGMIGAKGTFLQTVAEATGVSEDEILGHDLFLYNRVKGTIWGAEDAFLSSGRLDDLQCAFASLKGFLAAKEGESIPVHCVFDNEEVGSSTKQGAASTFLADTLLRINEALGRTPGEYRQAIASSFMVSADNAHAVHPNFAEKACPTNRPVINGGIVLKYSANQKYTTDGVSAALWKQLCEKADVLYQVFLNRSDMIGGSTLGNLSGNQVAVCCVDVGLPQLAMHSPYETAGVKDTEALVRAAKSLFESSVEERGYGSYRLIKSED